MLRGDSERVQRFLGSRWSILQADSSLLFLAFLGGLLDGHRRAAHDIRRVSTGPRPSRSVKGKPPAGVGGAEKFVVESKGVEVYDPSIRGSRRLTRRFHLLVHRHRLQRAVNGVRLTRGRL